MTDGEEVSRQRGRHVQKHRGVKREGPLGEVQQFCTVGGGVEGAEGHGKGFPESNGLSNRGMIWSDMGFGKLRRCTSYQQQGQGRGPF